MFQAFKPFLLSVILSSALLNADWDSTEVISKPVEVHDYVIVGGGTAGLTTAYLLAKDGYDVVVLERGPDKDDDPNIQNMFRVGYLRPNFYADYFDVVIGRNQPVPGAPDGYPNENNEYLSGRLLGGMSSVNESLYWRPMQRTMDLYGGLFADDDYVLNFFKALETYAGTPLDPAARGTSGPFGIHQGVETPFGVKFTDAISDVYVNDLGLDDPAVVPDWNIVNGPAQATRVQTWVGPDGVRQSSSIALLKETNAAVDVRLGATVTHVILKGVENEATGVSYIQNGESKLMKARKKVIVAAGMQSAAILQRSGIGDADHLHSLGIPVKVDNPKVGENLFNDIQLAAVGSVTPGDFGSILADPADKGAMSVSALNLPGDDPNDRPLEILAFTNGGLASQDLAVFAIFLNRVESRGSVKITSKDPLAPLLVQHNYLTDPGGVDRANLAKSAEIMRDAAAKAGYTLFADLSTPAAIQAFIDAQVSHAAHWGGTSAIGLVVDENLHVYGTKNLMVADFSAAPEQMRGHSASVAHLIGGAAYTIITGNEDVDFSP